jgi:lipopolysaccharide heptosyltransferase II
MKRYLIINPFGIGDVLFTTPIIKALRREHPDCFIGYWCNERVAPLLRNDPDINEIFPKSRGDIRRAHKGLKGFLALLSLIMRIKREGFDTAFDFSLDSRYGLWSKLAGIKERIGFDYKNRGKFLTNSITLSGYSGKHVIEHGIGLLKFIGVDCREHLNVPYGLEVSEEERARACGILKENGVASTDLLVGIVPGGGASWGKDAIYKQWPAQKFAKLAHEIAKTLNAKVVLLGSADEKPLADIIMSDAPGASAVDLTGKLGLKEVAGIISQLKLLICNDGGPLHMAAALGIKTVSVFGPVDEIVYGPYPSSVKHIVVKSDVACRPCYKDFRFPGCSNKRICLENITVEEVFEKAKSLL